MRDQTLAFDVVLVDPDVGLAEVENLKALTGRQGAQAGDADLDHEAPARLEVRGDVLEARCLLLLRRQVVDRVEDEVGE